MPRFKHPSYRTALLALTAVGILMFGAYLWLRHLHPLPAGIRKQVTFAVFYPTAASKMSVDTSSFQYDTNGQVLSYNLKVGDRTIVISEQPSPEAFSDVPQAYDKLIQSLGQYGSFECLLGKVYLTRPKDLGNQQSAVMNAKGTLMFAHPIQGELSDDEWRILYNSLKVVK